MVHDDWYDECDSDDSGEAAGLARDMKAAEVLQEACETLCPSGVPKELADRLHLLFAGVSQVSGMTAVWARHATDDGAPQEAVASTANRALNSLSRAATCVALRFITESRADAPPVFSDN